MTETPLALVTGGGAGIGAAICRRLALATGGPRHEVIVVDRDDRRAEETARSILADGGKALAVGIDITDMDALRKLSADAGALDLLVNNAGIFEVKGMFDVGPDDYRRMYEVNLVALAELSRLSAGRMGEGTAIVNIASRAMLGARNYAHYVASKAAVAGLTRAMALELADRQIRVNAVAPGVILSDMLKARKDTDLDALKAAQPSGRLGQPEDIAEAVAFLGSKAAAFITGQVLLVDGGRSLGGTASF
ncbi:MAG: short-chain dehydrogenase [Stappia sp.]|uniref:SDR family NAD(P)-dependent oxidoreductase n=1 Tax=Stappia sp. TaxID=1870903 RepID=UPI000C4E134C|nr:SDR family NAD(P)-dependent oxidoreductase [Stappia sp.]MAA97741.1 short-chain dehydrogenase [Stappia sp.]MBM20643.1 short-chain dehydrogenase [Stappia sp.]